MMDTCSAQSVNEYGDTMTTLMRDSHDKAFPWYGALFGSAIIGFWYWCTDQFIVQRVLSGKDQKQARRGTIFGAYLKLLPVFLFLIPGMIAFALTKKPDSVIGQQLSAALLPDASGALQNPDLAFPMLVNTLLPVGLKGVVICGILAALMSSLASLYNSSAMLYTIDIYKRKHPDVSEQKLVSIGRIATIVVVVLGVLWIFVIQAMGKSLYDYIQSIQSLLAPAIASVFLLGVAWKKTTPKAGMWTLIVGPVLGFTRLIVMILDPQGDNLFCYLFNEMNVYAFCVWMFLFCIVLAIVISLFTKKPEQAQIQGLVMGTATPEQKAETRASWSKWDIINSCIILAITVAFYIYFW